MTGRMEGAPDRPGAGTGPPAGAAFFGMGAPGAQTQYDGYAPAPSGLGASLSPGSRRKRGYRKRKMENPLDSPVGGGVVLYLLGQKRTRGVMGVYRIGQFSKINRVSVKTLRYYDEAGILKPSYVDQENGYRYYTSEQLPQIHKVIALRQIGFSVREISRILKGGDMTGIFENRKAELEASIRENQCQLSQISHYLRRMEEGFSMGYQVAVKELFGVTVYSKRMVIPDYDAYFEIVPRLGETISAANPGLQCSEPPTCFVIYHDGEYREKDIDIEFCEAVDSVGNEVDGIVFKQMEKVPAAACTYHKGPYSTIGEAYASVYKWIEDNGYVPCACPRESYIDGIWNKDEEEEWLTELQVPIQKA